MFCSTELFSWRLCMIFLLFMVYCITLMIRGNLSVALSAMILPESLNDTNLTSSSMDLFDWNELTQGQILAAYFYGYIILQIPSGLIADSCGGKLVTGIALTTSSLLTILTPTAAHFNTATMIATRFLIGLSDGCIVIACQTVLVAWVPSVERGFAMGCLYAGSFFGSMICTILTAVLCEVGHWSLNFYVYGIFGVSFSIVWFILVSDAPRNHRWISKKELEYITSNQETSALTRIKLKNIPLKAIFTSLPIWATLLVHWSNCLMLSLNTVQVPIYLKQVLDLTFYQSGAVSCVGFGLMFISSIGGGKLVTAAVTKSFLSMTTATKISAIISGIVAAVCYMLISVNPTDRYWNISIVWVSAACFGLYSTTYPTAYCNMAPQYAGFILSLGSTVGSTSYFIVASLVGWFTNNQNDFYHWDIIFIISGACSIIGSIIFICWSSAKLQPWAECKSTDTQIST